MKKRIRLIAFGNIILRHVFIFAGLIFFVVVLLALKPIQPPSMDAKAGPTGSKVQVWTPLDPQKWQDQQDMTWTDYHPIPGLNWADPSLVPLRKLRVALVAVDFPDQPFVITLPRHSDLFGNPQIDPIPRADVPQFYADFFGKPQPLNHGQTINGYWMEQSRGNIGIPTIDAYGPVPHAEEPVPVRPQRIEPAGRVPDRVHCDGRLEPDADALWRAAAGQDIQSKYDIVLRIYAGYDETGVWQEFGEMKFESPEQIPPEWGNPDPAKPRWVVTRYVPWTSWKAGQMQWGLSSVRQGENSGTITHEIAHFAFHIGDNNNNPYIDPLSESGLRPLGHHGPRVVQWSGRAASALGRAGQRGGLHAGGIHAAQPNPLRFRATGERSQAQPQRPRRLGTGSGNSHRPGR